MAGRGSAPAKPQITGTIANSAPTANALICWYGLIVLFSSEVIYNPPVQATFPAKLWQTEQMQASAMLITHARELSADQEEFEINWSSLWSNFLISHGFSKVSVNNSIYFHHATGLKSLFSD